MDRLFLGLQVFFVVCQFFSRGRIPIARALEQQQLLGVGKSCLGYTIRRGMPPDPLKPWRRAGAVLDHALCRVSKKVLAHWSKTTERASIERG